MQDEKETLTSLDDFTSILSEQFPHVPPTAWLNGQNSPFGRTNQVVLYSEVVARLHRQSELWRTEEFVGIEIEVLNLMKSHKLPTPRIIVPTNLSSSKNESTTAILPLFKYNGSHGLLYKRITGSSLFPPLCKAQQVRCVLELAQLSAKIHKVTKNFWTELYVSNGQNVSQFVGNDRALKVMQLKDNREPIRAQWLIEQGKSTLVRLADDQWFVANVQVKLEELLEEVGDLVREESPYYSAWNTDRNERANQSPVLNSALKLSNDKNEQKYRHKLSEREEKNEKKMIRDCYSDARERNVDFDQELCWGVVHMDWNPTNILWTRDIDDRKEAMQNQGNQDQACDGRNKRRDKGKNDSSIHSIETSETDLYSLSALLDFDYVTYAPLVWDLAIIIVDWCREDSQLHLDQELIKQTLVAYQSIRPLTSREKELLVSYIYLALLRTVVFLCRDDLYGANGLMSYFINIVLPALNSSSVLQSLKV